MSNSKWVGYFVAFGLGILVTYLILQRRKTITSITRDENGRIIEIVEIY